MQNLAQERYHGTLEQFLDRQTWLDDADSLVNLVATSSVATATMASTSVSTATTTISSATTSVATTTTATSVATATASTATATTSITAWPGLVDLDLLPVQSVTVQLSDGCAGVLFPVEGDEGESLAGVVNIDHLAADLKLGLQGNIVSEAIL